MPGAIELENLLKKFPQLGYKNLGFVSLSLTSGKVRSLGNIRDLERIINQKSISEVLVALEHPDKDKLFEIIRYCPPGKAKLKILPDTYEIVSGMARTNQIYGVPLIEVMPEIMPYGAKLFKRVLRCHHIRISSDPGFTFYDSCCNSH